MENTMSIVVQSTVIADLQEKITLWMAMVAQYALVG